MGDAKRGRLFTDSDGVVMPRGPVDETKNRLAWVCASCGADWRADDLPWSDTRFGHRCHDCTESLLERGGRP